MSCLRVTMPLIRSVPGTKLFGRRGKRQGENHMQPRPASLTCGAVQLYRVLPRKGDIVYCSKHQAWHVAGDPK